MRYQVGWQESLSCGDIRLDSEHRWFLGMVQRLSDIVSPEDEALFKIVPRFIEAHFAAEEACMAVHDYPDLTAHKMQHKKLLAIFSTYEREHKNGTVDSASFKEFLHRWAVNHEIAEDQKFSDYLASDG